MYFVFDWANLIYLYESSKNYFNEFQLSEVKSKLDPMDSKSTKFSNKK